MARRDHHGERHFAKRDRMGRLGVFLARILAHGWAKQARAIGVEEGAAVLLDADGQAKVIGSGSAYFLEANNSSEVCRKKTPLSFSGISVHRAPPGAWLHGKDWKGAGGDDDQLSLANGELKALPANHGIYWRAAVRFARSGTPLPPGAENYSATGRKNRCAPNRLPSALRGAD
jgi:cyanophycinase